MCIRDRLNLHRQKYSRMTIATNLSCVKSGPGGRYNKDHLCTLATLITTICFPHRTQQEWLPWFAGPPWFAHKLKHSQDARLVESDPNIPKISNSALSLTRRNLSCDQWGSLDITVHSTSQHSRLPHGSPVGSLWGERHGLKLNVEHSTAPKIAANANESLSLYVLEYMYHAESVPDNSHGVPKGITPVLGNLLPEKAIPEFPLIGVLCLQMSTTKTKEQHMLN